MKNRLLTCVSVAGLIFAACAAVNAKELAVSLTGDHEVPAVTTAAKGTGKVIVGEDKAVSGSVKTTGIVGVAAHIHEAPAGKNGPPIITLEKKSDSEWVVPAGAKLSDAQYASFKAGNLYINVHSAEHQSGEIRTQLKP